MADRDICAMVTSNPAQALGWEAQLGRLKAGLHADFVVMADTGKDAYRTLIESVEEDVRLAAINGYPIYGTSQLMTAAAAVNPEPIQVSATSPRIDHAARRPHPRRRRELARRDRAVGGGAP